MSSLEDIPIWVKEIDMFGFHQQTLRLTQIHLDPLISYLQRLNSAIENFPVRPAALPVFVVSLVCAGCVEDFLGDIQPACEPYMTK